MISLQLWRMIFIVSTHFKPKRSTKNQTAIFFCQFFFSIRKLKYLLWKWQRNIYWRGTFRWRLNKMRGKENHLPQSHTKHLCLHHTSWNIFINIEWWWHWWWQQTVWMPWNWNSQCNKKGLVENYLCTNVFCQLFIDPSIHCCCFFLPLFKCFSLWMGLFRFCVCLLFVYTHQPRWFNIMLKT